MPPVGKTRQSKKAKTVENEERGMDEDNEYGYDFEDDGEDEDVDEDQDQNEDLEEVEEAQVIPAQMTT